MPPYATRFAIALQAMATSLMSALRSPVASGVPPTLFDQELVERCPSSEHRVPTYRAAITIRLRALSRPSSPLTSAP
jgi:hypothetical protein